MSKEYRSNEEKLEILKAYANSKRDDLVQLDKRFNFHDKKVGIRGRVKLFRDSLLKHGYYEQLIEEGISVNIKETPKLGSKLTNNQNKKIINEDFSSFLGNKATDEKDIQKNVIKKWEKDEDLYLRAHNELNSKSKNVALWIKAVTLCKGDTEKAKYEYIMLRVNYLKNSKTSREIDGISNDTPQTTINHSKIQMQSPEKSNNYINLLSNINFKHWNLKNPYYTDDAINSSMQAILTTLHNRGYLKDFHPKTNLDVVTAIETEIKYFNFELPNFNKLAKIFDLIQAWGGKMGKMPYIHKKSRLKFETWKEIYLEGAKFSNQNKPVEAVKKLTSINGVGPSFATKHLKFWSKKYPILDSRISIILSGNKKLLNKADYSTFLILITKLAKVFNTNIIETEKAVFAFSQNFFPNENLVLYKTIEDLTDFEIAKKISEL